jgi:hypothetical protein
MKLISAIVLFISTEPIFAETQTDCSCGQSALLTKIPPQPASEICQNREKWIASRLLQSSPLTEKSFPDSNNFIMLGEAHHFQGCRNYVQIADLIFKKNGSRCLFLEFNQKIFKDVVLTADDASPVKCFKDLVESVENKGIKVFPVDKEDIETNLAFFLTAKGENDRDKYMASQIIKRKQQCDQSIMIVGKEHVSMAKPGRITLRDLLKDHYKLETVNLQNTKAHVAPLKGEDPSWTYNGLCLAPQLQFNNLSLFSNEGAPDYMDIIPREGHWKDFNKTILLQ